jgi:hypothetical protein
MAKLKILTNSSRPKIRTALHQRLSWSRACIAHLIHLSWRNETLLYLSTNDFVQLHVYNHTKTNCNYGNRGVTSFCNYLTFGLSTPIPKLIVIKVSPVPQTVVIGKKSIWVTNKIRLQWITKKNLFLIHETQNKFDQKC